MSKPTAITLFSGGGVADAGLIAAGFKIVAAVEREEWIADVYRRNYGDHIINSGVCDVDFTAFRGVDLVFGSAPCQGHSIARDKNLPDHKDKDVTLEAIDAIATIKPRWIVWENVPPYRKSQSYQQFRDFLFGCGYWINEQVIDTADYAVPQHRRRFIMLAAKDGIIPQFPLKEKHRGWYQAIADLLPDCPETKLADWQLKKLPKNFNLGGLLSNDGFNDSSLREFDRPAFTLHCRHDNWKVVLVPRVGFRGDELRLTEGDRPCPTLRALGHDQHWRQFDVLEGATVKKLTPRCEARLQTLPDFYVLPEVNWKAKRIVGNGFPSLAMEKIARGLIAC